MTNFKMNQHFRTLIIFNMILLATRRMVGLFSKWSRPKPKPKSKQNQRSYAVGDDKAAKLSKAEQEQQNKMRAVEAEKIQQETIRKISVMKTHAASLQQYKSQAELDNIKYYQELYLHGNTKQRKATPKVDKVEQKTIDNFEYTPLDTAFNPQKNLYQKAQPIFGNYTKQLNSRLPEIEQFQGDQTLRRMGTMGVKLGMTTLYDQWGDLVPVTIILLDRVQVVQIKAPEPGNKFYQVQMGIGEKKIKRCNKALLGHYLKSRVPPKQFLAEFPVSEECLLPVGYMMSARHYTPGMYIDVAGKTVGHGFQGTIKKYGFHRQPQSHGNSKTTRVLGSTGGRQDPGRVFKQKKMYSRMGGKISVQRGMRVFKIDVDKNIIYVKGTLPGKAGTVLRLWDTLLYDKCEQNLQFSHFPTFVEQPGMTYARQFSMYCGERDPEEIEVHDNAFILDDGDEASASTANEDAEPKDKDLQD